MRRRPVLTLGKTLGCVMGCCGVMLIVKLGPGLLYSPPEGIFDADRLSPAIAELGAPMHFVPPYRAAACSPGCLPDPALPAPTRHD